MIPDSALWVIIHAIKHGCQCKQCARDALVKALAIIDTSKKPNPYTSGVVQSNPTTFTNWESK